MEIKRPIIGDDVSMPEGNVGTITNVIRADSYGKWGVSVSGSSLAVIIQWDYTLNLWRASEYIPTRFPDEDGILKQM